VSGRRESCERCTLSCTISLGALLLFSLVCFFPGLPVMWYSLHEHSPTYFFPGLICCGTRTLAEGTPNAWGILSQRWGVGSSDPSKITQHPQDASYKEKDREPSSAAAGADGGKLADGTALSIPPRGASTSAPNEGECLLPLLTAIPLRRGWSN
jgi:hypothetical protein